MTRIRPRSAGAHYRYVPPRPARDWREIVEIALFPVLLVGIIVVVVVFGTPPPTP